jgi:hypothetical protein
LHIDLFANTRAPVRSERPIEKTAR